MLYFLKISSLIEDMKGRFNGISIIISCLWLLLVSCNKNKSIHDNPIKGKWVSAHSSETYWNFTSEENVTYTYKGKQIPGNETYTINLSDKTYEETVYGPLKYKYYINRDTIKFETYGSSNNKTFARYGAMRNANKIYIWNYKTLSGIEHHIDEVSWYCLEGTTCTNDPSKKITVIIDEDLKGAVHISFNQKDGIPYKNDKDNNPIITIDQGSIHKTTLPWHPSYMTENAFDFKIRKCETGDLANINDWGNDAYRKKVSDMRQSDTVTFKTEDYSLSAFSLGYNQYGRDLLDYEFGEYLNGQVASFSIDYLSDRYEYKEYMKKITSKGKDVKG